MDYETSFADYYKANFTDNINNQVKEAFKLYDLNDDQMKRITKVIVRRAENMSMDGDIHG